MEFEFYCPCGKLLTAEKEWIGKRAQCPQCRAILRVPAPNRVAQEAGPTQRQIKEQGTAQREEAEAAAKHEVEGQVQKTAAGDLTAEEAPREMESVEEEPVPEVEKDDSVAQEPLERETAEAGNEEVVVQQQESAAQEQAVAAREDDEDKEGKEEHGRASSVEALVSEMAELKSTVARLQAGSNQRVVDLSSNKGILVVAAALLMMGAFLLGRTTQTPTPAGASPGIEGAESELIASATPAPKVKVIETERVRNEEPAAAPAQARTEPVAEQQVRVDEVKVTGSDRGRAEPDRETLDVAQGQATVTQAQPAAAVRVTNIALAKEDEGNAIDAERIEGVRPRVDAETVARVVNQWGESVRLERLINCYRRNVYLAGTGEGVNLFLDPARSSVKVTPAAEATGNEMLQAVASNSDDLVSLFKVCQEFSAESAIGDEEAGKMLHLAVFPQRDEGLTDRVVSFGAGVTRNLAEVATQCGQPTGREWWAGGNMQELGMSGVVFWWGHVGVAAGEDGEITHVLLRGPRQ